MIDTTPIKHQMPRSHWSFRDSNDSKDSHQFINSNISKIHSNIMERSDEYSDEDLDIYNYNRSSLVNYDDNDANKIQRNFY